MNNKRIDDSNIIMPDLTGKTRDETIKLLDELNLKYNFKGNGVATNQEPVKGTEINSDTTVEVEFSEIKE